MKFNGENKNNAIEQIIAEAAEKRAEEATEQPELDDSSKLMKVRRKRHLCLKCMLDEMKQYKHQSSGGCGGGCGGGGGNYYQPQPVYQPVVLEPVRVQPVIVQQPVQQRPYYPPPQPQPQPQPTCNVCGGGGGGYGGNGGGHGGGNSYAQASAQASASASSYGGY